MQYHDGFQITYHRHDGKVLKAYVPPCWTLSGDERRQQEATDRAKRRRPVWLARYAAVLGQRRLDLL